MSFATTEMMWFFYYYTYWGFIANLVSIISSMGAVTRPLKWQKVAVISTEVSLAMNVILTLMFWGIMAPLVFDELEWSGIDLFLRF